MKLIKSLFAMSAVALAPATVPVAHAAISSDDSSSVRRATVACMRISAWKDDGVSCGHGRDAPRDGHTDP